MRPVARPPDDHDHSGDERISLGAFAPGTVVDEATVKVSGEAFRGRVVDLEGAAVTESPVGYASSGLPAQDSGQKGFVIDLGGMRTILQVRYEYDAITLVLPWMGTQFATKPLYPAAFSGSSTDFPTATTDTVDLPGIDTQKLFVQVVESSPLSAAQFAAACRLTTGTLPAGVKAYVNDRLPFWTNAGPLSDEVEVPGLAGELNALLADATDAVAAELVVAADTPGVIAVEWESPRDLSFVTRADASWGGSGELAVDVRSLEPQPVTLVWPVATGSPHWLVGRVELDLIGVFPPWRARSLQASDAAGKLGLIVSGRWAVARRVDLADPILLYGLGASFRAGSDAEVTLELQNGAAPDLATPPLAGAELSFAGAPGASWVEALFAAPVEIPAGTSWIVAKARKGSAEWVGDTAPAGEQPFSLFSDGGGRFEAYPSIGTDAAVAQARLLRAPLASENEPLLQLQVRAGAQDLTAGVTPADDVTTIELSAEPQVELAPASETMTLEMSVASAATGALSIARASAFYREKTT